ncbi:hypothetical protein ACFQZE_17605 [Paenibacillus sp. GCM10027627]|uniref:hypothetical protein n=1 Tax=unclassified Paenibacillus TaxID=185978 RepID=UPI003624E999
MIQSFLLLVPLMLILTGCSFGDRDISTVEKSMIGHWKVFLNEADETSFGPIEYYINENSFTMIEQGTKSSAEFSILESNENENWIVLNLGSEEQEMPRRLTFTNKSRTTLKQTHSIKKFQFESEWIYVDNKTKP